MIFSSSGETALGDHQGRHQLRDRGDGKRHVGVLEDELFARILIQDVRNGARKRQRIVRLAKPGLVASDGRQPVRSVLRPRAFVRVAFAVVFAVLFAAAFLADDLAVLDATAFLAVVFCAEVFFAVAFPVEGFAFVGVALAFAF